jgi:thiol-disulfide isomerase/thioredoxin/uncharacterized membrane protein YphA (DoxX/SURF4 family)
MRNKVILSLRILFFIFFFVSGLSKIYPNPDVAIHLFEKEQLQPIGIPFCLSTWLSRALIGLEFLVALGFLLPFYFKKITLPLSFFLLLFFSLFLGFEVFYLGKWTGNCGCFGQLIPMTPPESLVKNILALILLYFFYRNLNYISERRYPSIWFIPGVFVIIFSSLYILSPKTCIATKPIVTNSIISPEVKMFESKFPKLNEGTQILCFFSPGCPHCKDAAKDLAGLSKKTNINKHYIVFLEDESTPENIKAFISRSGIKASYTTLPFIEFPSNTDPPAILLIKDGQVVKRFFGKDKDAFSKVKFLKAFSKL